MREEITDTELYERYDDMLDECYEDHPLGYSSSDILKNCDSTAYRCGFSDWLDSELGETIEEVDDKYYDKENI